METSEARIIRYLQDAWNIERSLVDLLKEMEEEVQEEHVVHVSEKQWTMAREHLREVEERLALLDGRIPSREPMVIRLGEPWERAHDEYDKAIRALRKMFATQNSKMAMYGALAHFAHTVGDEKTAQLAKSHEDGSMQMAREVLRLIGPVASRVAVTVSR